MCKPVGGVFLNIVEIENNVDRDCQDQDEERQDVDVDGESLWCQCCQTFSSLLMLSQNKLECLSLERLI